jgi:hypothetical protein
VRDAELRRSAGVVRVIDESPSSAMTSAAALSKFERDMVVPFKYGSPGRR